MRITVFGASGRIGQLVIHEALDRGHDVVAFVHRAQPFEASEHLKVIKGDVHTYYDVASALQGSDAVISALGSWGTREKDILSAGMHNIVDAMEAQGVTRVVSLTGSDARAKGDKIGPLNRLSRFVILHSPLKRILRDGEQHIAVLEASRLDWMILRAPIMSDRGVPHYKLTGKRPTPWTTINRKAIARCMVEQTETATYIRKSPFIIP